MKRLEGSIWTCQTNWGVNFKSSILGTAKDQMIDDMVAIRLEVVAKKK
jgi:hypothetical protein